MLHSIRPLTSLLSPRAPTRLFSATAEVIVVCTGAPLKGMGWYHTEQLLMKKCPSAAITTVVEPYFLGAGKLSAGSAEFKEWQAANKDKLTFLSSLGDLPNPTGPRLAVISGRTGDNPRLLNDAIENGCSAVYLEKPGAPTVRELETMRSAAAAANVSVHMGYNKNVAKYVSKVQAFAATAPPGSSVTFVSNNAYESTPESLGECFERNSEGMLKNMAIHELALLVSFYDVTVENIESVVADQEYSSVQTLAGPDGVSRTDFDKIKFIITTKSGKTVTVAADRCGGTDSYATVNDAAGAVLYRYDMPDEEDLAHVNALEKKYPGAMPYFLAQDADYITVKERVAKFAAGEAKEAEGIATIDVAVETLRVAEFLTPELTKQLQ